MSERELLGNLVIGILLLALGIRLLYWAYLIYKSPPSSDATTYNLTKD